MARLMAKLEKLLFGCTAEEAAEIRAKWLDMRVQQALERAFAGLDADADNAAFAAEDDGGDSDSGKDGGEAE